MRKHRILVVEDDLKTAAYLKSYFDWQGYEVLTATQGGEALDLCRLRLPNAVILDVILPDMSGYDVCRILRSNSRTSYVPIIFLSHRNRRNDIIGGFEAGADDYIVKPFDIEELRLRVEGVIRYSRRGVLMHPVTGLPGGDLIGEQLRAIKSATEPWTLLYFNLKFFGVFKAISDSVAVNDVLGRLADILRDTVEQFGAPNDFVGHASDEAFVVLTIPETAGVICNTVAEQFNAESVQVGQTTGLMKLAITTVSSDDGPFADIREIARALTSVDHLYPIDDSAGDSSLRLYRGDLDYYHQLTEQVAVWQASPELAQALLETEQIIITRVPDINRSGTLLNLAENVRISAGTLKNLRARQQLCHLAGENLEELPSRIRRYQRLEPARLHQTLRQVVDLLPAVPLSLHPAFAAAADVPAAIPELKLQQTIYNVIMWLRFAGASAIEVSSDNTTGAPTLAFTAPGLALEADTPAILAALAQNRPGSVYAYLAGKIAARYGGSLAAHSDTLRLRLLPEDAPYPGEPDWPPDALRKQIRQHRQFLNRQRALDAPAQIFDRAAEMVDPLAESLLSAVEAMLMALQSNGEINRQAYPWTAIQHSLKFVRLLTLELRINRPLIPAPVNLRSLLENVKTLVAHRVLDHTIVIESPVERPVITSDQTRLLQIFVNLAINALDAMPTDGVLKFTVTAADYFTVEITDNGRGIAPESLPHIFDPHFSTKGLGRGAGLHNVKAYLEQLNGEIEVFSQVGVGTTFKVKLPPAWEAGYF